jgi:hypothetical protein
MDILEVSSFLSNILLKQSWANVYSLHMCFILTILESNIQKEQIYNIYKVLISIICGYMLRLKGDSDDSELNREISKLAVKYIWLNDVT